MLNHLKRQLKDLIGRSRHDEVFRRLREEVLDMNSEIYDDTILIEGRYHNAERAGNLGLIAYEEKNLSFNNVSHALLWLIGRIEKIDLKPELKRRSAEHLAVPPQQALTCDRVEQSDLVELNYLVEPGPEEKIRFFYLYGDIRQEHQSLFRRFGLERGGLLKKIEKESDESGAKVKFVHCKPPVSNHPKLFQIKILSELFSSVSIPVNSQQPILNKKLKDLLSSPELQDFGSNDFVFILLTLDDYNWKESLTPLVVRKFIEEFCQCELDAEAPDFFLFFGIEYQKENETVKKQVKKAIDESEYGEKLPELKPVTINDIGEWFSRNHILISSGKEAPDMAKELFPSKEMMDMADVEVLLRKTIDDHNKGLL